MKEQLMKTLDNSRNYTLAVAEAMPGNLYDSKPTGAGWSFKELMHHIAYGIIWWEENLIAGEKTDWNPPAVKDKKDSIILYLKDAYQSLEATIKNVKASDESIYGFHATLDHITHHRGQAVLHIRCQGITPPEYVY